MTIFQAYNQTKAQLEAAGIEEYVFEAKQILRHITGLTNAGILTHYTNELTRYQENNLTAILKQRAARFPLQYIFTSWEFYGRPFFVGPGVLCPRQDTETLVETALELLREHPRPRVLDLCAGSGCVGLTLAAERPDASVVLVEKYEEALRYARRSAEQLGVKNAELITGDIYESAGCYVRADLIVSNPPYIPADEMESISPEAKYEPSEALYGGEDGLMFYRAIVARYAGSLAPGGRMAFEVGFGEAEAVAEILTAAAFREIGFREDYNGIKRVVFGTVPLIS